MSNPFDDLPALNSNQGSAGPEQTDNPFADLPAIGKDQAAPVPAPEQTNPDSPAAPAISVPDSSVHQAANRSFLDTFEASIARGFNRGQEDLAAASAVLGMSTPEQALEEAKIQAAQGQQYPPSPEMLEFGQRFSEVKSAGDFMRLVRDTPVRVWSEVVGDSLGNSVAAPVASAAGGLAGGLFGGPGAAVVGTAGGAALGGAATGFVQSVGEDLRAQGIDINDEEQFVNALADPKIRKRLRNDALKYGIPLGAVDGLFTFIGARGLVPAVANLMRNAGRSKATSLAANLGASLLWETTGEVASEAAASFSKKGEVFVPDLMLEAVAGLGASAPQAGIDLAAGIHGMRAENQEAFPTPRDLSGPIPEPEPVRPTLTEEEALTQGYTFVGSAVEGDTVIPVSSKREEQRRATGEHASDQQTIYTFKEEDTELSYDNISNRLDPQAVLDEASTPEGLALFERALEAESHDEGRDLYHQALQAGLKTKKEASGERVAVIKPTSATFSEGRNLSRNQNFRLRVRDPNEGTRYAWDVGAAEAAHESGKTIDLDVLLTKVKEAGGRIVIRASSLLPVLALASPDVINASFAVPPGLGYSTMTEYLSDLSLMSENNVDVEVLRMDTDLVNGLNYDSSGFFVEGLESFEEAQQISQDSLRDFDRRDKNDWQDDASSNAGSSLFLFYDSTEVPVAEGGKWSTAFDPNNVNPIHRKEAERLYSLLQKLLKLFRIPSHVIFLPTSSTSGNLAADTISKMELKNKHGNVLFQEPFPRTVGPSLGTLVRVAPNLYIIHVTVGAKAQSLHTFMHEFGHLISATKFLRIPLELRTKIYAAYDRYAARFHASPDPEFYRRRVNSPLGAQRESYQLREMKNYFMNFEEWFAQQTARYMLAEKRPFTAIARVFYDIGRTILRAWRNVAREERAVFRAEPEVRSWLEAMLSGEEQAFYAESVLAQDKQKTQERNKKILNEEIPYQPETFSARENLTRFMNSAPNAQSIAAHVDRFNWFYKYFLNFRQLADLNPHLQEIQQYRELIELAQLEANQIMEKAEGTLKEWRSLNRWGPLRDGTLPDGDLNGFLFALTEGEYLTAQEKSQAVRRQPTVQELQQLKAKYKLSPRAVEVYEKIENHFIETVRQMEALAIAEAQSISDPANQQAAIQAAQKRTQELLRAPYFPLSRFGKWAITIRDAKGNIQAFYTFETKREQQRQFTHIQKNKNSGETVTASTLPEEVQPFIGMPPWLIDKVMDMPGTTPDMKRWLEQLRYELAPSQSFTKRLLKRKAVEGYSLDGQRAFAHYFFHFARNHSRIKYGKPIAETVKSLRAARLLEGDVNNRTRIADYMEEHYNEFVNPSKDWSILRSIAAVWYLGAMPASAFLNMTQTVIMTQPFLGSKFGDAKAAAALTSAAGKITSFYKRGTMAQQSELELKVLSKLIEEGKITESMAAELAAVSSETTLKIGGRKAQEGWIYLSSKAMWLFQMMEQWNRRVTARAAFNLAVQDPGNSWLDQLETKHKLQFDRLVNDEGWTAADARAFLAAKDAIDSTHYDYSKVARPRFMRGRSGLLFTFYMFTQNTIFTLMNPENKGILLRYLIIMSFLAGPLGVVPDELEDVISWLGTKFLGKDFDVEREARKLINQLMGEDSEIAPDLLLHGISRYGFGLPKVMDMMGATWFPYFDRSRSVALQQVLPVNPMPFFDPTLSFERAVSEGVQGVAGAGFGIGFNVYKALTNNDLEWGDPKRWENAMPRALKQGLRAARLLTQGGERDRNYNELIDFDPQNTEHVAELIGISMGYNPTRVSQTWDRISAEREVMAYWKIRRNLLLREAYRQKYFYRDGKGYDAAMKAIRKFNTEAPDGKLRISSKTLKTSFQNRLRRKQQLEAGKNPDTSPAVAREVQGLYPETVLEKKVK